MKDQERITIVLLGEKDHGKSTLIGRLFFDTKSIPEDRLREVKKASEKIGGKFEWAHLLDSFKYERRKEMTLDATRALITIHKNLYEFIDVPGHEKLLKNFLSGATDADFGILVIAADEGIKPQTKNHLSLAKFLNLKKIIVAVNKIDSVGYSKKKFKELSRGIRPLLPKDSPVIPISAYNGENLIKKSRGLHWFSGPTLKDAVLKTFKKEEVKTDDELAVVVQDVYGKNVAGKILRGSAKRGDILINSQNKKKWLHAECVFLEMPTAKNLKLESNFREVDVEKINLKREKFKTNRIKILLKEKIFPPEKFVLKKEGKIVGICRII